MGFFKPLLTRAERRDLPRDERKQLRESRIASRKADRPRMLVVWHELKAQAEDLIFDLVETQIDGQAKMDEVVDTLVDIAVEKADTVLVWTWAGPLLSGPLEAIDGVALNLLLRGAIEARTQALYNAMKADGRFGSER